MARLIAARRTAVVPRGGAFARLRMEVTTGETCLSELRELRIERAAARP